MPLTEVTTRQITTTNNNSHVTTKDRFVYVTLSLRKMLEIKISFEAVPKGQNEQSAPHNFKSPDAKVDKNVPLNINPRWRRPWKPNISGSCYHRNT